MASLIAKWLRNVLVALDETGNAMMGGDPEETISSRAAKARNAGRRWGCLLCRLLDKLDPGHCDKFIQPNEGSDAVIPDA